MLIGITTQKLPDLRLDNKKPAKYAGFLLSKRA
jgi:hypothetical protein